MPNTPRMFPAQNPPPQQGWPQQQQPPQQGGWMQQLPPGWQPPGGLRKSRGKLIMAVVGMAIGVAALLTVPGYCGRREVRAYRAELARRADMLKRWTATLEAGTCYRRTDGTRWLPAIDLSLAGKGDPFHDLTAHMGLVEKHCDTMLKVLEADPDLPDNAHAAIRQLIDADKGLAKLDDGAPDEVKAKLEARDQVREKFRTEVLPPVREKIRKIQENNAANKNYIWWRIELGMQLESIFDLAYATHRAGKDILPVINVPLHAMIEQMYKADKEVGVKIMGSLVVLGHSTDKDAWGNLLNVEDNGTWDNITEDNSVFGPMPPEPQGCEFNILDVGSTSILR